VKIAQVLGKVSTEEGGGTPVTKPIFDFPDGPYYIIGTFEGVTNPIFQVNVPRNPGEISLELLVTRDKTAVWVFNDGVISSVPHSQMADIVSIVINALNTKYQMPEGYGPLIDGDVAADEQSWIDTPSPIEV